MQFSESRAHSPFSPPIATILEFLLQLFHGDNTHPGLSYSALNTARSALSTIITIDHAPAGQHPLVKRFMRAVFNKRPALPRNTITWDVDIVLNYLKTLSPVKTLSLAKLTKKLLMLLLLLSGHRGQTIHLLDIRNMTLTNSKAKFQIGDIIKTTSPGHHVNALSFSAYAPDRRLCVIRTLTQYLTVTEPLRGTETLLFVTIKKPHRPVSRDTLRRWVKDVLKASGIDIEMFTPHSTRAASTSKASQFVPLKTILETATWSSVSTFTKYYKKPVPGLSLADAVRK